MNRKTIIELAGDRPATRSLLALAAVGAFALTGCGSGQSNGGPDVPSPAASTASAQSGESTDGAASGSASTGEQVLTVDQQWMKAKDSGMTGVFGTLTNDGDEAVTLSGATAEGIAGEVELHETVMDESSGSTVMQKMAEPLVIEPGESVTLEPGGDHIMLMDLECAPMAGQTLPLELTFEDGRTQKVDVEVRDYQGAQEEYSHEGGHAGASQSPTADDSMEGMEGMDHGELPMCEESA